jgi:hypothetical protein
MGVEKRASAKVFERSAASQFLQGVLQPISTRALHALAEIEASSRVSPNSANTRSSALPFLADRATRVVRSERFDTEPPLKGNMHVKMTFTRLGLLCAFALSQGCNHTSHGTGAGEQEPGEPGYEEETPGDEPSAHADAGGSRQQPGDQGVVVSDENSHLEGPSASATVASSERFKMVSRVGIPANTPLEAKAEHFSIKSSLFSVRGKK